MIRNVVSLTPDLSLEEAVNRFFLPYGHSGFPVLEDGRLRGFVTVAEVQAVSMPHWPFRRIGDIMQVADDTFTVSPDTPTMQAVDRMLQYDVDRLAVVEHGLVVGLITRAAIAHVASLPRSDRQSA